MICFSCFSRRHWAAPWLPLWWYSHQFSRVRRAFGIQLFSVESMSWAWRFLVHCFFSGRRSSWGEDDMSCRSDSSLFCFFCIGPKPRSNSGRRASASSTAGGEGSCTRGGSLC
uniref:Uncharacterized protein n=1 Tax=Triticum urartu TaxID=4572 RepID=A0A8R7K2F3_TRIUA